MKLNRRGVLILSLSFLASAQGAQAGYFGVAGRDGGSGYNGQSGRSGQSLVIRVTGQPLQYNLAGQDASAGTDARDGEDAMSCAEPRHLREDLRGASGGDGGRGGQGGSGGNGGSVTLIYDKLSDLSSLLVYSPGGRGAPGGRSGRGGRGCGCSEPIRYFRDCSKDDKGVEHCRDISYSCYSGAFGNSPSDGSGGSSGSTGSVLLIHSSKTLTADAPNGNSNLGSLLSGGLVLTRNLYNSVPQIGSYLAQGSYVQSTASEFDRKVTVPVSFSWNAPQSLQTFASEGASMYLGAEGELSLQFPNSLWIDSVLTQKIGGTDQAHVEIKSAYRENEIGNLSFSYIAGTGKGTVAQIDELNNLPTDVPVTFSVLVENKQALVFWKDRWTSEVPASLVQKVGNQYRLAVGQLPQDTQYLSGHRTRITVTAQFSMGGRTKRVVVARIASL